MGVLAGRLGAAMFSVRISEHECLQFGYGGNMNVGCEYRSRNVGCTVTCALEQK